MGYRLVATLNNNNGGFIPYESMQNIDVPDLIVPSNAFPFQVDDHGKRFLIEYDKNTHFVTIIKKFESDDWIMDVINDLNKYNLSASQMTISRQSTPVPDDLFMGQLEWDLLNATIHQGLYPLFTGPSGCGKTVGARAVSKALGFDYHYLNCGALSKPKQTLVGAVEATSGSTHLVKSEFLTYFSSDKPTAIFLDEISRISSQAENYMMTILDKEQSYIYVEELAQKVFKGPNVVFIAAANFGIQYVGTRSLDAAFLDRFVPIPMDYLPPEQELDLVNQKHPGLNQTDVKKLIRVATLIRRNADEIGQSISHRRMIQFAGYLKYGFSASQIVDSLIINTFNNGSDDRRDQVRQILSSI